MSEQTIVVRAAEPSGSRRRVGSLIAGSIVCVFAVVFLVGGGWALWKDRMERDGDGFVTIGTASLQTETFAIVGDLHGDGPSWWWESGVIGDSRVRATSDRPQPLFIGIARTGDLLAYLHGAGYATIDSFEVRPDTTHPGGPPSAPPSREPIWVTSTEGTGEQMLRWDSRPGDWSVVFMNADAGSGVAVQGDASAEFPILPWVAIGFLVFGAALGCIGCSLLVRGARRPGHGPAPAQAEQSQAAPTSVPAVTHTGEEVNA